MKDHLISLPTDLVYRVFNLGATSLVIAEYQGQRNGNGCHMGLSC